MNQEQFKKNFDKETDSAVHDMVVNNPRENPSNTPRYTEELRKHANNLDDLYEIYTQENRGN